MSLSDRSARLNALQQALKERILILDGGMGTMIQSYKLEEADYRGARFADWPQDVKGNNDLLILSRPDVIGAIEKAYLDAGADILETNTFNATQVSQADYGMQALAYELNVEGARLARQVADAKTLETPDKPRFVAGVLGPTSRTCSISPDVNNPGYRNVTFDELVENYVEATRGLIEGGADLILIETIFDTLNAKAAIFAVQQVFEDDGIELPIMISGTITDASGRTLSGQTTEAFWNSVRHAKPFAIGLNEVQVGLVAPEGIQRLLRRAVGMHRAGILLTTAAMVPAEQALQIGLVDELADDAPRFARIVLTVKSDLEGVGLTAAVATALAEAGMNRRQPAILVSNPMVALRM